MLKNQHGVAVGEEAVFFRHGLLVGFHHKLVAAERRHHHEHGALRGVEVGDHGVGHLEAVGRVDELVGPHVGLAVHFGGLHHAAVIDG